MDALCLIAAPGAGAGDLCRVLAQCPDVAVHHQLFQPHALRGISPEGWALLSRLTGVRFGRTDDPALATFARERPAAWLDAIEAADRGKRILAFTLFSDDLASDAVEQVLSRSGVRAILVMRKPIEAYVAWQASLVPPQPHGTGEPGAKPSIDVELFATWLGEQERWYAQWQAWLTRRFLPCPVIRYETDIDQPAGGALRRAASAAAQVGVTLRIPVALATADAGRPPRPLLADTVANWPEVNREIFARGLERRAFGYPLSPAV